MKHFLLFFLVVGSLLVVLSSCNLPGGDTSIPPAGGDEETPPDSPGATVAPPSPPANAAELVQPADIEYLGAFRLPDGEERPLTFDYGGNAMTFDPDGDPDGAADGFPGSLHELFCK